MKRILLFAIVFLTVLTPARGRAAAETWTEMKSAHFTVWSSAGEGQTRDLLWQLQQIRFAVSTLWPWTRGRAAFHVGTGRLNEARALIAEARKTDANQANTFAAEGLLLEREDKPEEANAAFVKAATLGSTSAYAYQRAATSMRRATTPDEATLRKMETHLARATELNPFRAESYASLAEVRAGLHQPPAEVIELLTKAVTLDPSNPWIRIMAARTLWRLDKLPEARKVASVALALAGEDAAAKAQAERLLATIPTPQGLPK